MEGVEWGGVSTGEAYGGGVEWGVSRAGGGGILRPVSAGTSLASERSLALVPSWRGVWRGVEWGVPLSAPSSPASRPPSKTRATLSVHHDGACLLGTSLALGRGVRYINSPASLSATERLRDTSSGL
ncbi:hypothetical protein UFOVP580_33 [uncultured Caudovirales phage]|uniref:Uncharacterized protein n=1 Tax=uncultured Caudovirales phage TaxID=2100421 RepID=A0A6J5PFR7_9CAUD|nr:hypothetical protein UFOVP580_33 [uncultured Caudovirales phage]